MISNIKRVFTPFIAVALLASCGNNTPQSNSENQPAVISEQPAPEQTPQPQRVYNREDLLNRIAASEQMFKNAPTKDALERLAGIQYATTQELLVIARALDSDGSYRDQIEQYQERFSPGDATATLGRRVTDSMLGIYSTFALLYTMRFSHSPDKLKILETIGKDIEGMMARNDPIIKPLGRMAEGNYVLLRNILRDIDQDNTLEQSFTRSDSLYRAGVTASKSGEDEFLNALYRTFELGQIWVLQLNPEETRKTTELKEAFRNKLIGSKTVGDQMANAMEYIYRSFHLAGMLSVDLVYPETAVE